MSSAAAVIRAMRAKRGTVRERAEDTKVNTVKTQAQICQVNEVITKLNDDKVGAKKRFDADELAFYRNIIQGNVAAQSVSPGKHAMFYESYSSWTRSGEEMKSSPGLSDVHVRQQKCTKARVAVARVPRSQGCRMSKHLGKTEGSLFVTMQTNYMLSLSDSEDNCDKNVAPIAPTDCIYLADEEFASDAVQEHDPALKALPPLIQRKKATSEMTTRKTIVPSEPAGKTILTRQLVARALPRPKQGILCHTPSKSSVPHVTAVEEEFNPEAGSRVARRAQNPATKKDPQSTQGNVSVRVLDIVPGQALRIAPNCRRPR